MIGWVGDSCRPARVSGGAGGCVVVDVSGWEGDAIAVRYEQAWVRIPRLLQPGGSVALVDGLRDDIP